MLDHASATQLLRYRSLYKLIKSNMIAPLLGKILKYSQTLGKEDILTAIVATMFDYSHSFMNYFFHSLTNWDEYISDSESEYKIETGITHFIQTGIIDSAYCLRPDMLIASRGFSFESKLNFILIESKINTDLTTNQYRGYPEIKRKYNNQVSILLISNYYQKEFDNYFDRTISWLKVLETAKDYINYSSNEFEKIVLNELINTFYEFGIKFNKFLFTDLSKLISVNPNKDLSEFIRSLRKATGMTQEQFSREIGVALTIIRGLEQNSSKDFRVSSVNKVLNYFNCQLGPVTKEENKS